MNKFLLLLAACFEFTIFSHYQLDEQQLIKQLKIVVNLKDNWVDQLNNIGVLSIAPDHTRLPAQTKSIPLFDHYPALRITLPHISLGDLPTPIEKLNHLGADLSIKNLYIKRDDLSGTLMPNGTHLYGGNKVRKLAFLLAQAMLYGTPVVITLGPAGSNHALATSVYANLLGIKCTCILVPQARSHAARKNLLMHLVYDTELYYYPNTALRKIGAFSAWLNYYHKHGKFPYIIPAGGSNALGSIGFVNAAFELKQQIEAGQLPEPDLIYVPCGSAGTTAGLLLGCKAAELKSKIVAVTVGPEDQNHQFKNDIAQLFHATNNLLHSLDPSFKLYEYSDNDLRIVYDCCGPRYAVFTEKSAHARSLIKDTEQITLDGTYTAKALAGLINDAEKQQLQDKIILFWNTYCGLNYSSLINSLDYRKLPFCFHEYFEQEVQSLDME